ncbi:bifunctional adenosylcobinamide kinase/adenosylcobinamide-phosphate guanylyltransferase [Paenibacillus sp. P26]|nr:bifunctional adenosylcobinamide kinase/adenosylcobinamide-phosphate guanylyltransferase [Paenibacillus sp. P26]
MKVLVTGGARSGKSGFAEAYAAKLGAEGVYVATGQAYDEEMEQRIAMHRREREASGFPWRTIEEPLALAETLLHLQDEQAGGAAKDLRPVVLVDCLTLWLSNWSLRLETEPEAERRLEEKIAELAGVVTGYPGLLLLVTNEVGYGLVPEYKLGRRFRDLSGRMNQRLARSADQVILVTSGIPVELSRIRFQF